MLQAGNTHLAQAAPSPPQTMYHGNNKEMHFKSRCNVMYKRARNALHYAAGAKNMARTLMSGAGPSRPSLRRCRWFRTDESTVLPAGPYAGHGARGDSHC